MVTNYYPTTGEYVTPETLSPRVFKFLKRYSDELLPHERLVVLTFNEYPFRDFVPMTPDGYNGGVKLPSHLIVPCIRFVDNRKYHFLGSLFFHSEFLQTKPEKFGKHMADCIKLYILALQNVNIRVVATVCPLSAIFHHAIEVLTGVAYMEEFDGPLVYSCGVDREIIHIHDPKYVRDGFIRWFMLFDLQFTLNGKSFTASRYDITDVLEYNNRPPLLQKPTNNSKYYEHISYCYFNEKTSIAIRRLIKQGYIHSQAIGTSIFINMFRQLFHRIYGLNDDPCEIFDFERTNEYIEFIKSICAVRTNVEENEDYQQDIAGSLPFQSSFNAQNHDRDNPIDYQQLYPQPEKSLETLTQKNMYESIMITTTSGKTFVPVDLPQESKKTTKSKNKKKNKKERKKLQQKNQDLQKIEDNSKSSLNNEIKLLDCEKKRKLPGHTGNIVSLPSKIENKENIIEAKSPQKLATKFSPNPKIKKEDPHNPNLNENIRKYEKPNKCTSLKSPEQENAVESIPTTITENLVDFTVNKFREFNLDDEIKEISYSISDPDDSTEYQFDQVSDYDEKLGAVGVTKTNSHHDDITNNAEVNALFQNYLTKGHIKDLMKPEPSSHSDQQFDSFIQFLKNRSLQYTSFLNEKQNTQPKSGDFVKISMKADDKVDIQKISAEDFKQPSLDLFGISKRTWPTTQKHASFPIEPKRKPGPMGNSFDESESMESVNILDATLSNYDEEMSVKLKRLIGIDQEPEPFSSNYQTNVPKRITMDLSDSSDADQKLDEDFLKFEESVFEEASRKQMDLLSSYAKNTNAVFTPPSLRFLPSDIKRKREKSRFLNLQCGASSDSEGDYRIVDRIKANDDVSDEISHDSYRYGKMDKPEFNSEYDDIDELNKHVKLIINKLEEKDVKEISKSDKKTSTAKESTSKRGYVKKEIYHESGESLKTGAVKRTIFHRDKTEESTGAPKFVIRDSENSCDKSKIASTKASYKETLGIKFKKDFKDEQHDRVVSSVSQTVKGFASILNLPETEEEKNKRISTASLDFVYDLSKLKDEPDLKKRQKLFDLSYNHLCLTSFGKNTNNPNILIKMKELKTLLRRLAFPNEITPDPSDENILSMHVNKTIASSESPSAANRYVREDVQNLWINNIRGIEKLFRRLDAEKYLVLSPEIFKTDHVEYMMNYIQANGLQVENFPIDENCLPVDLPECFDTLKPFGSAILNDA